MRRKREMSPDRSRRGCTVTHTPHPVCRQIGHRSGLRNHTGDRVSSDEVGGLSGTGYGTKEVLAEMLADTSQVLKTGARLVATI